MPFFKFKKFGHSAILFNGSPKPEACWSIPTVGPHCNLDSNKDSHGCKQVLIPLSYPNDSAFNLTTYLDTLGLAPLYYTGNSRSLLRQDPAFPVPPRGKDQIENHFYQTEISIAVTVSIFFLV